jgi:hypothetical protein
MAEKEKPKPTSDSDPRITGPVSRIEIAYHGKRTDARDRSSEDPARHTLPRAVLSPRPDSESDTEVDAGSQKSDAKKRSFRSKKSKSKEKERRASRERELEKTRKSPQAMPQTVEMNFEVLRAGPGIAAAAGKTEESSPAAKKRSLSFQFWREQQLKKSEERQAQIEARKSSESRVATSLLPKKSPKPESVVLGDASPKPEKKFGRSASLSTLFGAFARKKSSPQQKSETRKLSSDLLAESSPLNPEFHASIVQGPEEGHSSFSPIPEDPDSIRILPDDGRNGAAFSDELKSQKTPATGPLQAWRLYRQRERHDQLREIPATVPEMSNENSEADPVSLNIVRADNQVQRAPDPEIPTPDYDQVSHHT